MKAFLRDQGGVASKLMERTYGDIALVPPSPWLSKKALDTPTVRVKKNAATGGLSLTMLLPKGQTARWFLVQARTGGVWGSRFVAPCACADEIVPNGEGLLPDRLVVTAFDRAGVASPTVKLSVVR
jgi:hypothetical protein